MARISQAARVQVRAALLASAAEHFAAHGLQGANINRISLDAGYAKGTIYNYFSSKEELFQEVLALGTRQTLQHYHDHYQPGDARQQLQALAAADVALVREHQAFMKTLLRELVAPTRANKAVLESLAPLVALASDILAQGQAAGLVRTDVHAARLAQAFLGQLTMAYAQHWMGVGLPWDELAAQVTELFFAGAGPRDAG